MVFRPLLYITLAYSFGIALSGTVGLSPLLAFLAALVLAVGAAAVFFALRRDVFIVLPVIFLLMGMVAGSPEKQDPGRTERFLGKTVDLEGYICRDPDYRRDRVVYIIEVLKVEDGTGSFKTGGRVILYVSGSQAELGYGDVVRVRGRLFLPSSPGNPGQFDYGAYLSDRGIWAVLAVKDRDSVQKIGTGNGNSVAGVALSVKQKLIEINRSTLSAEHAALVNGIVFGCRGEIDRRTQEIFNESGVVHILSVSGLHVGLVAAGVMGIVALTGLRRMELPVLTSVLAIYAFITGMGPAVVRSAIMAWICILGQKIGRERDWATTLAASALIILVFSPRSLFDPGFQLSYAATWGILHLGPVADNWLESKGLNRPWVRGIISVSLGAQAGTLPLVAYYYNIFSIISIPANILAVPLVGLILPLGILAPLVGLLSLKAAVIINFSTAALLDLMMFIVGIIHGLPGGVVNVSPPPFPAMAAWYAFLALLPGMPESGGRSRSGLRFIAAGLLAVSLLFYFAGTGLFNRDELQVHVIDVGQGDSMLVRFPNGKNMLVDAGGWEGEFEKGRGAGEVVAAYLKRMGIGRLDTLVITHPHEDHAAGAGFLLDRFDIGFVLIPPDDRGDQVYERPDPAYKRLIERAMGKKIPVREIIAGDIIAMDPSVRVEVLGPGTALLAGTRSDLNNNSVVLSVRFGKKSFLFTGDIEEDGQAGLLERGVNLKHSVLKVPHHGSRYLLPELVERVSPEVSVISVGRNNFGQPHPGAIAMVGAGRRPVYRTDRDGLVLFVCDGKEIRASTGRNISAGGVSGKDKSR
ncbi:MAG: DNA internalization-related competence protein ComEC/Rec2 [Bacillota bacterium]